MKLTLGDALSNIAPEVLPESAKQIAWLNAVSQRMHSTGKWAGTTVRWRGADTLTNFAVFEDAYGGRYFTLPRNLLSILSAAHGNPGDSLCARFLATRIRGPWYEFGSEGWGAGDSVTGGGIQDAGDGFTCFRDITEDSYLRVKTEVDETAGVEMLFRGLDENDEPIYTSPTAATTYEGVKLDIGAAFTTTTTQIFSSIPSLITKPVTFGPVRLYAVSVASATETLIGMFDPGETAPGYRRYRIACAPETTVVQAMCKRRHVPAVVNADEIIPASLGALELGLQGRRYELNNDTKTAAEFWLQAFALLNSELSEHNGGAMPTMQFERGRHLGRIPIV